MYCSTSLVELKTVDSIIGKLPQNLRIFGVKLLLSRWPSRKISCFTSIYRFLGKCPWNCKEKWNIWDFISEGGIMCTCSKGKEYRTGWGSICSKASLYIEFQKYTQKFWDWPHMFRLSFSLCRECSYPKSCSWYSPKI